MTAYGRRVKQALQVQRVQTWPATFLLFFAAYLTAGGELFTLEGLSLAVLTVFIHGASFGHNVIEDYWMDKNDPAKDDHPLTSGDIEYSTAVRWFNPYLFAVEMATLVAALVFAPGRWEPIAALFVMEAAGHWYNDASYSSRSMLAFVPISITWTAFAAFGWLIETPETPPLFYAILGYALFRIWFQISVSGRLKEFGVEEEVNELRLLGAELKPADEAGDREWTPGLADVYAYALSVAELAFGMAVAFYADTTVPAMAVAAILLLGGAFLSWRMMRQHTWTREDQMDRMSFIEVLYIFALVVILAPVFGPVEAVVMLGVSLLWFVLMNRILWDTPGSRPDV